MGCILAGEFKSIFLPLTYVFATLPARCNVAIQAVLEISGMVMEICPLPTVATVSGSVQTFLEAIQMIFCKGIQNSRTVPNRCSRLFFYN